MNIARMNALLSASAPGFQATFSAAGKNVEDYGHTISSVAGAIAVVDLGKSLLESAYNATAGLVKGQMEAIDHTAKLSDTLGIQTEELGKLQYAASFAGVSNEDLGIGIQKMLATLDKAVHSGGDAAAAFNRLGLDAQKLANLPTAEAFGQISQALDGVQNASERVGLERAIFGKGGTSLNALIGEGSDQLQKFGAEAVASGNALNRIDSNKVEQANEAINRVEKALTGAANILAVQLSPFLTAFADKLESAATSGTGLSGAVVSGFESIVKGVAIAADYLDLLKAGWNTMRGVAGTAILETLEPLNLLIQAVDYLYTKLHGTGSQFAATSQAIVQGLRDETAAAFKEAGDDINTFNSGANVGKASKLFDAIRSGAQTAAEANAKLKQHLGGVTDEVEQDDKGVEKAAKTIEELKSKVEEFGKAKEAVLAIQLAGEGATSQQIAQAQGYQKQLDALEQQKKAHEDAAKSAQDYYDKTRTPAEKYAEELDKINKLVEEGALDSDTAERARQKAQDDLDKSSETKEKKQKDRQAPQLLQAGSQEAANFIANFQAGASDPQKQTLEETKKHTTYLKTIADAVTKGGNTDDTVLDI